MLKFNLDIYTNHIVFVSLVPCNTYIFFYVKFANYLKKDFKYKFHRKYMSVIVMCENKHLWPAAESSRRETDIADFLFSFTGSFSSNLYFALHYVYLFIV